MLKKLLFSFLCACLLYTSKDLAGAFQLYDIQNGTLVPVIEPTALKQLNANAKYALPYYEDAPISVSYTHLDVYKRQSEWYETCTEGLRNRNTFHFIIETLKFVCCVIDVYKRQMIQNVCVVHL